MKLSAEPCSTLTKPLTGSIFNIQRFSLHDGPGIRTVVFFKGCLMRCGWCANPEGLRQEIDIFWRADNCLHCGSCIDTCPNNIHQRHGERHVINRTATCNGCLLCEETCPAQALKVVGKWMTLDAVHHEVSKDLPYYFTSGGGVTLSGGEVMLQPAFAGALLQRLRVEGIHTAVETAGFASWASVKQVCMATDLILYDLKLADDGLHRRYTGVSNVRILRNLEKLLTLNIPLRLRIPVIPGVNDTEEEMTNILNLIASITAGKPGFQGIDLLPWHAFGVQKYSLLGLEHPAKEYLSGQSKKSSEVFLQAASLKGLPVILSDSLIG